MTSTRLRLAALALVLAAPALAAEKKMPGLTFDAPSGVWTEKQVSDGLIYQWVVTYERRKAGALIAISTRPLTGHFDQAFLETLNGLEMAKGEEVLRHEKGVTTNGVPMQWALKCCRLGEVSGSQTMVAFHHGGMMVYGQLLELSLEDEDKDKAEAAFARVIASFDLAGLGRRPPVPTPAPPGETVTGLFLNVASRLQLNPFGGMDFVVDMNTYYFEPGGLFATEPPSGAGDLAGFCPSKPDACGTYKVANGRITLNDMSERYGLVETETADFAREDKGLKIGGASYQPVEPASQLKLDGSWTYFWASSGSTATNSGSVSSSRTIVFTKDGHFTRSGFSSASSTSMIGDTTVGTTHGSDKAAETGTYTIDGYTLTLDFGGGRSETLGIYLPDRNDLDLLVINGHSYLRDGRDKD